MKRLLLLLAFAAACQTVRAQEPVLPDFNPSIGPETGAPANGAYNQGERSSAVIYREIAPVKSVQRFYPDKRWRVALDAGYSAYTIDGYWDYYGYSMVSGFYYGADVQYFWGRVLGLGAKFSGNSYAKTDLNTYYVGPILSTRVFTWNNRNAWIFSVSAGYVAYNQRTSDETYNRGGFKMASEIGFDIRISEGSFFGLKIAATEAYIPFRYTDHYGYDYNELTGLFAIEIGAGLRF